MADRRDYDFSEYDDYTPYDDIEYYDDEFEETKKPKKRKPRGKSGAGGFDINLPKQALIGIFASCLVLAVIISLIHYAKNKPADTKVAENVTTEEASAATPETTEAPTTAAAISAQSSAWNLLIVNKDHPVADTFSTSLMELRNEQKVDERVYPALQAMFDAAREAGYDPIITASFRTKDEQKAEYDKVVEEQKSSGASDDDAAATAEKMVGAVETSEHRTGLAIDITDEDDENASALLNWLKDNSYKYGFVLRYTEDKISITGVAANANHFRYVGKEAAQAMHDGNYCLEEYVAANPTAAAEEVVTTKESDEDEEANNSDDEDSNDDEDVDNSDDDEDSDSDDSSYDEDDDEDEGNPYGDEAE